MMMMVMGPGVADDDVVYFSFMFCAWVDSSWQQGIK